MFYDFNEDIDNIYVPDEFAEITSLLRLHRREVQTKILKLLDFNEDCEESKKQLMEIIRYAISFGGRHYRSFFVRILGESFEINKPRILFIGAIIEMLHSYILMQNEMPDIENNDYRCDKMTCHRKFGNAKTMIASNALITLIMDLLANNKSVKIDGDTRCKLVSIVTKYSGKDGVSGGQMMNIILKRKQNHSQDEETRIRKLKINSLFNAGAECIEILAGTSVAQNLAIKSYINNICNLINIYDEFIKNKEGNLNELLKRAKLFTLQGSASVAKLPNNKNFISFIRYNKYCIEKLLNCGNSSGPVIVQSDIATI